MRNLFITHLLLNLYLLAIIQPLYPVLDYLVNYNYIVNELCENREKPVLECHGKCYLGKQIEQQSSKENNRETPIPPEIDLDNLLTLRPAANTYFLSDNREYKEEQFFHEKDLTEGYLNNLLRPPRV